jgi:hypothetical protein
MLHLNIHSNTSQAPQSSNTQPEGTDACVDKPVKIDEHLKSDFEIACAKFQVTQTPLLLGALNGNKSQMHNATGEQQCLQYFKARLGTLKQHSSNEYRTHCPFHQDNHPSLTINPVKRVWYCLSACQIGGGMIDFEMKYAAEVEEMPCDKIEAQKRIEEVLGNELLFSPQEPEAIYDYTDETGQLLSQVLRLPNKNFLQRRPDGNGGWIYNVSGTKKVLYHLPEVVSASRVFVVEGEKDADNLKAALEGDGWATTTAPGGAGKWRDGFSPYLAGKEAFVLPDNDDAGQKHAFQVASAIQKYVNSVKIVALPGLSDKGDVSDFLTNHTAADLLKLAEQTPAWKPLVSSKESNAGLKESNHPKIITLSDVQPCKVPWLWEPYLAEGMVSLLSGDPGAGKTFIAQSIAAALSIGQVPYTQEPRPPADVLYLSCENSPEYILRPRFDLLGGDPTRFHVVNDGVQISDISALEYAIEKTNAQFMVVDPIQSFLGPNVDAHRANETRPLMDNLSRLAAKYKCCILLLRHLSKATTSRAIYRGMGSIDFTGAVRTELLAGCSSSDPAQCALVQTKSNIGKLGTALGYTITADGFSWTGQSELTAKDLLSPEAGDEEGDALTEAVQFLTTTLADKPRLANKLIEEAKQLGISKATLKRAKKQLNVVSKKVGIDAGWEWFIPKGINTP